MSDVPNDPARRDAASEAAQNVVDEVTSWEYSADRTTIESRLDEGLREAGVQVDDDERRRLVEEIDEVKQDETSGSPSVRAAEPAELRVHRALTPSRSLAPPPRPMSVAVSVLRAATGGARLAFGHGRRRTAAHRNLRADHARTS